METNYIWEKQIEEAEILIVNKIDLLSPFELESLQALIKGLYPTKQLLFQNSLDQNSVTHWVETIRKQQDTEHKTIDVDYVKYGAGEANLAWLDEEIEIVTTNNTAVEVAYGFIKGLLDDILKKSLTIGHMKFYLSYNNQSSKISFTTVLDVSEQFPANFEKASTVNLLVNARIQTSSNELRDILFNNLHQMKSLDGVVINEKFLSYFQPGYPNPTHRLA
jgi:G3E family GTPase